MNINNHSIKYVILMSFYYKVEILKQNEHCYEMFTGTKNSISKFPN